MALYNNNKWIYCLWILNMCVLSFFLKDVVSFELLTLYGMLFQSLPRIQSFYSCSPGRVLHSWMDETRIPSGHCYIELHCAPHASTSPLYMLNCRKAVKLYLILTIAIVFTFMLLHCGMIFLVKFVHPPRLEFSDESLRLTYSTKHIHHNSYIS